MNELSGSRRPKAMDTPRPMAPQATSGSGSPTRVRSVAAVPQAAPPPDGRRWRRATAQELREGIRGQNNLEFEELNKPRYALSEAGDGAGAAVDDAFELHVVDMAPVLADGATDAARAAFAAALGAALEELGFAVLVGHGVDAALYEEAHRRTPLVFTDTSESRKAEFRAERIGAVNQGWFPREETSNLHPDQVEGWVWCRRAFQLPGGMGLSAGGAGVSAPALGAWWPQADQEPFWRQLVEAHERIAPAIFRGMLEHVGVADPAPLVRALEHEMSFALRLKCVHPLSFFAVCASPPAWLLLASHWVTHAFDACGTVITLRLWTSSRRPWTPALGAWWATRTSTYLPCSQPLPRKACRHSIRTAIGGCGCDRRRARSSSTPGTMRSDCSMIDIHQRHTV
jgi:hypothetical protein